MSGPNHVFAALLGMKLQCTLCGKPECSCWARCLCGWFYEADGGSCGNPKCTARKARSVRAGGHRTHAAGTKFPGRTACGIRMEGLDRAPEGQPPTCLGCQRALKPKVLPRPPVSRELAELLLKALVHQVRREHRHQPVVCDSCAWADEAILEAARAGVGVVARQSAEASHG